MDSNESMSKRIKNIWYALHPTRTGMNFSVGGES